MKDELKFLAPYIIGFFAACIVSICLMWWGIHTVKEEEKKPCYEKQQLLDRNGLVLRPYKPKK